MFLCKNVDLGYTECFSRFVLDNKRELANNRAGLKRKSWSDEDVQRVYEEVKKGTPSDEIMKMFPERTTNAVGQFITAARKKYGIKARKKYSTNKVDKFDLNGNYIETINSIHEASKKVGTYSGNIINCCKGRCKSAAGFIWRYTDEKRRCESEDLQTEI